jgi:hypothetical protein
VLKYIKRCITFTEKTRHLFEINKGIEPKESRSKPHLVNKYIPEKDRKIPFRNMIYVGDGMTDIPSFTLPNRVTGMHSPNYSKNADLGIFLRAAVASRCLEIEVDRRSPRRD